MPSSAITLKKLQRRFGIAAPRVIIKSHIAWQWYVVAFALLVVSVAVIVWFLARQGDSPPLERQIRELREQLSEREGELVRLRSSATTEQNVVQMERSAQQQLISRIKTLEHENAGLKEEVSLFERLVKECSKRPVSR